MAARADSDSPKSLLRVPIGPVEHRPVPLPPRGLSRAPSAHRCWANPCATFTEARAAPPPAAGPPSTPSPHPPAWCLPSCPFLCSWLTEDTLRGLCLLRLHVPRAQRSSWHGAWPLGRSYESHEQAHGAAPPGGPSSSVQLHHGRQIVWVQGRVGRSPLRDLRGGGRDLPRYRLPGRLWAQAQDHVSQPFQRPMSPFSKR